MRRSFVVLCTLLVAAYGAFAYSFFVQERWARSAFPSFEDGRGRHPEALLAAVRGELGDDAYGGDVSSTLERAILEAPSFHEGPFLLAAHRERSFRPPSSVRPAYEAAIARFPASGRLHLAYGLWLLRSRSDLTAWYPEGDLSRPVDPLPLAEARLRSAMALEPELARSALSLLSQHRVPPERWIALVPERPRAQSHLVDALFGAGHFALGWERLLERLDEADPGSIQRAVQRGLEEDRAELALAAAEGWLTRAETGFALIEPALWVARAHFALEDHGRAEEMLASAVGRLDRAFGGESAASLALLCAIGDEYLRRKQPLSAEAWYGEAAARSTAHVPALFGLARSRRAARDLAGAVPYYERVLRIEPGHDGARQELAAALRELASR